MAAGGVKVLEGVGAPQPNFQIVANNVRHGGPGKHYVLRDASKLKAVVDKWRFEPKSEPIGRCGYDYQIMVTNGPATIPVSICFSCNTLAVHYRDRYRISKRQILALLAEDFEPVK